MDKKDLDELVEQFVEIQNQFKDLLATPSRRSIKRKNVDEKGKEEEYQKKKKRSFYTISPSIQETYYEHINKRSTTTKIISFLRLPQDVFNHNIFPFLDSKTYVNFWTSCKTLWNIYQNRKSNWLSQYYMETSNPLNYISVKNDWPMIQSKLFSCVLNRQNILLHGPAGTGKTTLMRKLKNFFEKNNIKYEFTTTTNQAAIYFQDIFDGLTIHSLAGIGILQISGIFSTKKKPKASPILKELEYVVIDEFSMMAAHFFETLHHYCCFSRNSTEPFGGLKLILVGDIMQLPPVMARSCFHSPIFYHANFIPVLTYVPFRQLNEINFFHQLQRLRLGSCNEKDIQTFEILNENQDDNDDSQSKFIQDIVICHNIMIALVKDNSFVKSFFGQDKITNICTSNEMIQKVSEVYKSMDDPEKHPNFHEMKQEDDDESDYETDIIDTLQNISFLSADEKEDPTIIRIVRTYLLYAFLKSHKSKYFINSDSFLVYQIPILVANNDQQATYNKLEIDKIDCKNPVVLTAVDSLAIRHDRYSPFVHQTNFVGHFQMKKFDDVVPKEIILKPGAQYRITKTHHNDIRNGQLCIYLGFHENEHFFVTDKNYIFPSGEIKHQYHYQLDYYRRIYRKQLSLRNGYATTFHGSQGMTLKAGLIEFGKKWNPLNGAYVALSRMESTSYLRMNNFNPNCIRTDPTSRKFVQHLELFEKIIPMEEMLSFVEEKEEEKDDYLCHLTGDIKNFSEKQCFQELEKMKEKWGHAVKAEFDSDDRKRNVLNYQRKTRQLMKRIMNIRIKKELTIHSSKEKWGSIYKDILIPTRKYIEDHYSSIWQNMEEDDDEIIDIDN